MWCINYSFGKDFHRRCQQYGSRYISILYLPGDKAKETYAPLKPYMDFKTTFAECDAIKDSIRRRRMPVHLDEVLKKYNKFLFEYNNIQDIEQKRRGATTMVKDKLNEKSAESELLVKEAKLLKEELRHIKERFHNVESDLIYDFLNLPNVLHKLCPHEENEELVYASDIPKRDDAMSHLKRTDLIKFVDNSCYYLMNEAAEFDIDCTHTLTDHFVGKGQFTQTSNPDFVRRILLEANTVPIEWHHAVHEEDHHKGDVNTAFLLGGGSFESFLAAIAKLCVYPTVLPLRLVCNGRHYRMTGGQTLADVNLYTAIQSNAVQTFVATATATEADQQMKDIIDLAIDFYASLNVQFRVKYNNADELLPSESLRASIEMHSPARRDYVCVGYVSNYKDYVSRRLLFATRMKKDYQFLHLIGGPVLLTTQLIAVLLENQIPLHSIILRRNHCSDVHK